MTPVPDEAWINVASAVGYDESNELWPTLVLAVLAAAPLVAAAALDLLADDLEPLKAQMREEDGRTIRSSGLGEGIDCLRARASSLRGAL